jgi:hypothetical protein
MPPLFPALTGELCEHSVAIPVLASLATSVPATFRCLACSFALMIGA